MAKAGAKYRDSVCVADIRDFDTVLGFFPDNENYKKYAVAREKWRPSPEGSVCRKAIEKSFYQFIQPFVGRLGLEVHGEYPVQIMENNPAVLRVNFNQVGVVKGNLDYFPYIEVRVKTKELVARAVLSRTGGQKLQVIEDFFKYFYEGNGRSEPKVKTISGENDGYIYVAAADWMPRVIKDMKKAYTMMRGKEFKGLTDLLEARIHVGRKDLLTSTKILQSEYDQRLVRLRTHFKVDVLGKK